MVIVKVGGAFMPCLLGKGRLDLPSPLGVVGCPSMGPPLMAHCRSGGSPRAGLVTMLHEPSIRGERLKPSNRSVMNSRLPKWMVPPSEETSCGRCSPPVVAINADHGTIGTFGGKAHCKPPFLVHELSVFFAPARYRVVKITCSSSEEVLRTTKNYKAHYSLS
jgi:hypothetical protein